MVGVGSKCQTRRRPMAFHYGKKGQYRSSFVSLASLPPLPTKCPKSLDKTDESLQVFNPNQRLKLPPRKEKGKRKVPFVDEKKQMVKTSGRPTFQVAYNSDFEVKLFHGNRSMRRTILRMRLQRITPNSKVRWRYRHLHHRWVEEKDTQENLPRVSDWSPTQPTRTASITAQIKTHSYEYK